MARRSTNTAATRPASAGREAAQPTISTPDPVRWVGAALLAVAVAIVLATFRHYGVTWDENVQAEYGDLVLAYFRSGFADTRCNEYLNLRFYAPLSDLVGALVVQWTGGHRFETRHLVLALTGLAGVVGTFRFGAMAGGPRVAFASAIVLATMPRFYGNAFNNPKDIPLLAAFVWSMVAIVAWLRHRETPQPPLWKHAAAAGVAIGATLAVRPGVVPVLAALLAAAVAYRLLLDRLGFSPATGRAAAAQAIAPAARASLLPLAGQLLACIAMAWIVMVAPWPWAHEAPFAHPWKAIAEAANFSSSFPVLFEGKTFQSDALPQHYLPKYFAITTPPTVLMLIAIGFVAATALLLRRSAGSAGLAMFVAVAWAVLPIAAAVVLRPNLYDSIRHFLFVLPAFAVLAGVGLDAAATRVATIASRSRPLPAYAINLAAAIVVLWPALRLVQLHPYESSYFNVFAGGLRGAMGQYETDYWVASYKEAVEWANAKAAAEKRTLRVLVAANDFNWPSAATYVGPGVELKPVWGRVDMAALPAPYDYYIATTRYRKHEIFPRSPVAHTIGRDGAVFTVIRARE
jgi:hypothetical protein